MLPTYAPHCLAQSGVMFPRAVLLVKALSKNCTVVQNNDCSRIIPYLNDLSKCLDYNANDKLTDCDAELERATVCPASSQTQIPSEGL